MHRSTAKDIYVKMVQMPEVSDAVSLIQIAETINEIIRNQISTRDHIATKAMAALIAEGKDLKEVPKLAYEMADLMMEARKK